MITHFKAFFLFIPVAVALAFVAAGCTTSKEAARTSKAQRPEESLKALKEKLAEIETQLRAKQNALDEMRRESGINDTAAEFANGARSTDSETLRRFEAMRVEALVAYVEINTMLTELQKKSRAELKRAISTAVHDAQLITLLEQGDQAEQKLESMKKDLGLENPEIVRTSALLKKINTQIEERLDGIMAGLAVRVASSKARLDELSNEVGKWKKTDFETATRNRRYFDAKREIVMLQQMRDTLNLIIVQEQIDQALPR